MLRKEQVNGRSVTAGTVEAGTAEVGTAGAGIVEAGTAGTASAVVAELLRGLECVQASGRIAALAGPPEQNKCCLSFCYLTHLIIKCNTVQHLKKDTL